MVSDLSLRAVLPHPAVTGVLGEALLSHQRELNSPLRNGAYRYYWPAQAQRAPADVSWSVLLTLQILVLLKEKMAKTNMYTERGLFTIVQKPVRSLLVTLKMKG